MENPPSTARELALLRFSTTEGAEQAFAGVRERTGQAPWMNEVAFVEHRRSGRLVVRGTVAGNYLDAEEDGDVIGPHTGAGALAGALAGAVFGPAGLAVGFVSGAAAGGTIQAQEAEQLGGEVFAEIRDSVPRGASALMMLSTRRHVDAMIAALRGVPSRRTRPTRKPSAPSTGFPTRASPSSGARS